MDYWCVLIPHEFNAQLTLAQTVGGTVDEAAYLYTLMERSCEIQLMVEAAAANGIPKIYVEDEAAAYTFKMASDPETLYHEFQQDFEYEHEMSSGGFDDFEK